jgi:hypothetical protein
MVELAWIWQRYQPTAAPVIWFRERVGTMGRRVRKVMVVALARLPNVVGKADIFGRTRDAGRVIVRFVGLEGNQAIFVRQDVVIQSNETTMSRSPMVLPTYQTSNLSGNVGVIPVSATQTTVGTTYVPPGPSSSYPIQAGQIQLTAPIGGSVLVEGQRIRVLRAIEGGIEYSVN